MINSYCHGLASFLQTFAYQPLNKVEKQIKQRLLTLSYRDENGCLIFQGDSRDDEQFDFGTGTLGIYWTLLGKQFPFEITELKVV